MTGGNNTTDVVYEEEVIKQKYQQCVVQLELLNQTGPHLEEPYCKGVFDGWSCWPDTPAGTVAFAPCPEFITGFDPTFMAHKDCTINGTWFKHPKSGLVWSNYTTCVNMEDLNWSQKINTLYETGYAISLVALLLSLIILSYFKSLRCPRITLHMNLFTSFAINNLLWLLWYRLIVPYPEIVKQNGVWCQCLHVILHYFLLTNYSWMFGEGFYLHTLLVSAFISEERLVKWLTRLAWIIPFIFITIYVKLRLFFGQTDKCWIEDSPYMSVLTVLVCCSMVLNLIFLCNIVRVLLTKLRSTPSGMASSSSQAPSRSLLQALRATLLLLPLLGLNYLVTPFRPQKGHPWEEYYEFTSAITASFQGLCVATLFCFCNGEVIAQIRRRWQYIMFRPRANSYTATTVSVCKKNRSWNGMDPSMNHQTPQVNNCLLFVRSTACPNTGEDNV